MGENELLFVKTNLNLEDLKSYKLKVFADYYYFLLSLNNKKNNINYTSIFGYLNQYYKLVFDDLDNQHIIYLAIVEYFAKLIYSKKDYNEYQKFMPIIDEIASCSIKSRISYEEFVDDFKKILANDLKVYGLLKGQYIVNTPENYKIKILSLIPKK